MKKKTEKNPFGAGRSENTWTSTRRTIPDDLWPEIKQRIKEWRRGEK